MHCRCFVCTAGVLYASQVVNVDQVSQPLTTCDHHTHTQPYLYPLVTIKYLYPLLTIIPSYLYPGISEAKKRVAKRRIMSSVSEAYGRMLLLNGLFQADGHPGNILVLPGR